MDVIRCLVDDFTCMTHVSIIRQVIVYVDTAETSWMKMEIVGCLKSFHLYGKIPQKLRFRSVKMVSSFRSGNRCWSQRQLLRVEKKKINWMKNLWIFSNGDLFNIFQRIWLVSACNLHVKIPDSSCQNMKRLLEKKMFNIKCFEMSLSKNQIEAMLFIDDKVKYW